jgi:hypothetical protein
MSIKSRDMTGQKSVISLYTAGGDGENGCLTIAWYSWERHIEVHGQLFSPAPVDNYRGVDVDSPIVEKFHDCKRQYDCDRDQRHCGTGSAMAIQTVRAVSCTHRTPPCVF